MEKLPATSDHVIQFMDEQDHKNMSSNDANYMAETKLAQNPSKFQTLRRFTFSKPKARVFEFNSSFSINQKTFNLDDESNESFEPSCENDGDSDDEYDQEHHKDEERFGNMKEDMFYASFLRCWVKRDSIRRLYMGPKLLYHKRHLVGVGREQHYYT
ncbi:hypothetical protein RND71_016100 [Anisodus tanguticus]|uniref:Uncharacterized protein n=1 Tax=Anisodus tanguticus TaxID=243964 RepID=A0AAE1S8A1_9SOLA|nr:hypothetical protein RND71_016100 [Anisodus tanguticus]